MLQKFAGPLVGAPFCGAPVRPNMLNMPKSASDADTGIHITKHWKGPALAVIQRTVQH